MNWEAIGAVAEALGAVGVIATLVYLAFQIRQNTRSVRLSSFQSSTDALNAINTTIAGTKELTSLFTKLYGVGEKYQSIDELEPEDRTRLSFITLALFRSWETAYYQRQEGLALQHSWERYEYSIKGQLANPVIREWWINGAFGFTDEFTEYVDGLVRDIGAGT